MPGAPPSPLDFYASKSEESRAGAALALRRYQLCRKALVAVAIVAGWLLLEAFRARTLPLWAPAMALPLAAYIALQARRSLDARNRHSRLRACYQQGTARLTRQWNLLEDGAEYLTGEHFYARDLDLFGPGSLFQLLCSARTQAGRDTLARWMQAGATREEALERRAAIAELRDRRDLRESLALAGESIVNDYRRETFEQWLATDSPRFPWWQQAVAFLLSAAVAALSYLALAHRMELEAFERAAVAVLVLEGVFAGLLRNRVRQVLEAVRTPSVELPLVLELLRMVERERFSSAKLASLAERVRHASSRVGRLRRLLNLLDQRRNEWFAVASYFLLWGTQFAMPIDRWRRRHGPAMRDWLAALGEFEALMSLAAYAYEHPADTFPELADEGPLFDAQGFAHPLLDAATAVRNDVRLGGAVRFLIVSGSNMSGKSTFLRAIGLNAVLAWMGAPVRSTGLRLSPLRIGAAIRVQDSLMDGRSHFLAEMERLRRMIEASREAPLLFLADEILSGTNSHDRRIAAEWVVRALVEHGAIGAVTTHDLALTEIAAGGLPGANVHFTDVEGAGNLDFDYKLRPGLLNRSNALSIARMLGIAPLGIVPGAGAPGLQP